MIVRTLAEATHHLCMNNVIDLTLCCMLLQLFEVARACKVVICCRVAPLQKAAVVNLIKSKTGELTLAIGDGE